ncbi:hypothetical protein [Sphingomonas sp.]|uniref:hypothetical protein n=1 Tax=Sphingomonas sp. TaxID=28214 RepID=UPI001B0BF81B|nr:hypothetical protein [Sphingomonas sp.]MBO9713308.1 hypothetical protein [Sphingomonas sp.]
MSLRAFQGDPLVRDAALMRLRAAAARDAVKTKPLLWDGTAGSPLGCLLASEDPAGWTDALGLPAGLALPVELLSINASGGAGGLEAFLLAVPPGADATPLVANALLWMLDQVAGASSVAAEVREAQAAALAGASPPREAWRALRKRAMAATAEARAPAEAAAATMVEAMAWDPTEARSVLRDALDGWVGWCMAQAPGPDPLTQEEQQVVQAALEAGGVELRLDLPVEPELARRLDAGSPGLAARMEADRARIHGAITSAHARLLDELIRLARQLPAPATCQ